MPLSSSSVQVSCTTAATCGSRSELISSLADFQEAGCLSISEVKLLLEQNDKPGDTA